ncbi:MFS transporter [Pseudoruegeria sp. SHC-113]|uniref:MFS transporter n=1 Tax=Pseudoruegeria sp. SHC-113 TaxID=2855439 RepID=UPI0021BADBE9|nr:MFS transporter [Pseudoruegeria sp. SHC-113]MCT8161390.1 MFS transporter [Pseudoruegeria sp. SHC-113]
MAPETAFSFAALSPPARRHIRVFQVHQFLDRLAMGLTVSIVVLALADRGMDPVQISALFAVYALTTMAMEVPFGGVADSLGRKPVFLSAVVASLISIALFLSSSGFPGLALSFAFIGFGRALRSGTLDAWFVEGFWAAAPRVDVQPALARAQWANALGLATGAVLGGLLPDVLGPAAEGLGLRRYDVSYVASFGVMLGVFLFTMRAIAEAPRPKPAGALWQGFAEVPSLIGGAARLAASRPPLSLLLVALAFFLMATNPVEVFWPPQVKPMLNETRGNTVIGVLTAGYFFAIAAGAALSPVVSRIFGRRHALTLAAAFACLAGLQLALALQGEIFGFVAVFLLYALCLGISETPASSLLHQSVDDRQRSTMLSLRSLIQQLGAAVGLLVAGAIAEAYGTAVAWALGAGFLALAVVVALVLARHLAADQR